MCAAANGQAPMKCRAEPKENFAACTLQPALLCTPPTASPPGAAGGAGSGMLAPPRQRAAVQLRPLQHPCHRHTPPGPRRCRCYCCWRPASLPPPRCLPPLVCWVPPSPQQRLLGRAGLRAGLRGGEQSLAATGQHGACPHPQNARYMHHASEQAASRCNACDAQHAVWPSPAPASPHL